MDNLELVYSYEFKVDNIKNNSIKACSCVDNLFCFICENNRLFVYDGAEENHNEFQIYEVKGNLKFVQYLPLYKNIFMASETELTIFDTITKKTKIVHILENKILNLAWNFSHSMLVLIDNTGELQLYLYASLTLDESNSLTRSCIAQLTSIVPASVMVGWGSQNTQFRGPKQRKQEETQEIKNVLVDSFDGPPRISWRGNGEQFVINYFKDGCRHIKVFDNQLNPLFESNGYQKMTEPVSFMGQGQYIACCIVENNANNLVIFEKNCKLKAVSQLEDTTGFIKKILFHPQMNMFGLLSKDGQQNSFVDIYTCSNAHWYLKQRLYFPASNKVHDFFWIETNTALFTTCKIAVFTNTKVEYHTFRFVTNINPHKAIAGVIDGKRLNIHMFENTMIPPPMCSHIFENTTPINRVIFHPHKPLCILVDSEFRLHVLNIEQNSAVILISVNELQIEKNPKLIYVDWKLQNEVNVYMEGDELFGDVKEQKSEEITLKLIGLNKKVNTPSLKREYFISEKPLENTEIFLYQVCDDLLINEDTLKADIALNSCRELFINNSMICSGVTSAILFKKYLIWTTSTGILYCVSEKQFQKYLDLSKTFARPIEQGARIVCCNNMTPPQIILQLPRGNLETISCKMITIDIIDEMLSNNEWDNVLHIMRIEKINWNVLIDLNPKQFYENIETFVVSATFCSIITAIVTEFNLEENCFQTIYKHYLKQSPIENSIKKIDIVEKILDVLCSKNCVKNLCSIVAIQQKHISLKSALISIKQVYDSDGDKNEAVCSKAIRQVMQQAHLKDTLNAAFTIFDLRLLGLIYRNSNEDPKVYGPELMNLRSMGELERRFRLCLKAYSLTNAVKYLLICDKFDKEFINSFIIKNKLEHIAYKNVCNYKKNTQFKLISELYAKRLTIEGKYVEAAFILKCAGLFEESLEQYRRASNWREVIALLNILKYNEEQKIPILQKVASELLTKNNCEDAVFLYEYHIKDYKKAAEVLIEFKAFHRAVNLTITYNEQDLLENLVIPSLLNYSGILMEKVDHLFHKFYEYVNRLQTVREKKRLAIEHGDGIDFHNEDDEIFSDTSSISSGRSSKRTSSSRRSTLSSRNRRKEERKKTDLREGGFYEDIALMRVLHIMYEEVHEVSKEVRDICLISELQNTEFSSCIHRKLNDLQIKMKNNIKIIWPEVFYKNVLVQDPITQAIIQNKNDLDPKYCIPPSEELLSENWKLAMFI